MSQTTSQAELLRWALNTRVSQIHTALPAEVVAYDLETQTVDVQPLIKRVTVDRDGNQLVESLPQINAVPVLFPRAGGAFVSFPVAEGDTVLLVFSERSLDLWRERGGEVDPGDLRMHQLADAIAIPGLYPSNAALADAHAENIVIGFDGGAHIHIKPNGEVHLGQENPASFVSLATATDARLTALEAWAATHTHTCSAPSTPSSSPVVPPTPGSTTAATKTKAL